jgi:SAM-dependent methyltransferase
MTAASPRRERAFRLPPVLRDVYRLLSRNTFDPMTLGAGVVKRLRALPTFARNALMYRREALAPAFRLSLRDTWFRSFDRYDDAAVVTFHYFLQDLWAATNLYGRGVREHVDVASRVDGFIANILPFCAVTYVDTRPLAVNWPGFTFRMASVTALPFADRSLPSVSSLHVIEHIGLGRYGDAVDGAGHERAAAELQRVLAPGGVLLLGVPVGRERVCFDAHRIFDPRTVRRMFPELEVVSFSLIDDRNAFKPQASFADAQACDYGCGLFELRRSAR